VWEKLARNPLWTRVSPTDLLGGPTATFQVQVFAPSQHRLLAPEQESVYRLFVTARQTLVSVYNHQQRQVGDE
jgi:hypothetical protein